MNEELDNLLAKIDRREPASAEALDRLVRQSGFVLPDDYVAFMASSNGGEGDVGLGYVEIWPIERVESELAQPDPRYEGVLMFAGDGANTVYGFDRGGAILEGDWVGLNRDELIAHGRSLADLLRSISDGG